MWKHSDMDDDVHEELVRLRARAYGPEADIANDARALARLAELEDRERRAREDRILAASATDATPSGVSFDPQTPANPHDVAVADTTGGEASGTDPVEGAPARRRPRRSPVRSRRALWLWAVSIAVVAAVTSAATATGTTFAPVARTAGVAQVDTLVEDPAFDVPSFFGPIGEGARGFPDYLGLTAIVGFQDVAGGARTPCLYLVDAEDLREAGGAFQGGFIFGGCGAGAFAPTAQFVVSDELPEQLRERFPVGTSLQFVFDGDRVGVFTDAE